MAQKPLPLIHPATKEPIKVEDLYPLFARCEGIIPAPESSHAIAATINEALKCKVSGEKKTILFNLSGHGLIDMTAYDRYFAKDLANYEVTVEEIAQSTRNLEKLL